MLPHTDSGEAGPPGRGRPGAALDGVGGDRLRPQRARLRRRALARGQRPRADLAGVAADGLFCLHALRAERPLLDVRLYANRVFAAASLTTFGLGAALFGAMILVPLYYQEVRHESVIDTGLLVGPQGLGNARGDAHRRPPDRSLRRRPRGARRASRVLCLSTIPLAFVGAHTSILGDLGRAARARRGHRLLLHAGDDRGVRLDASGAALRRDPAAERRCMRLGGAIGTAVLAVVLQRASGAAHTAAQLAGAFDTAYWWALGIAVLVADPVRDAAARRAPARPPRRVAGRPPRRQRAAAAPREPRSSATARQDDGPRRGAGERRARRRPRGGPAREQRLERARPGLPQRRSARSTACAGATRTSTAPELSHAQFQLLIELHERGELPAGELRRGGAADARRRSRRCSTRWPQSGHVERARSATDRRVVVSRLTAQGRAQIEAKRAAWQARWERALAGVRAEELRAATVVLERLAEMFEQARRPPPAGPPRRRLRRTARDAAGRRPRAPKYLCYSRLAVAGARRRARRLAPIKHDGDLGQITKRTGPAHDQ